LGLATRGNLIERPTAPCKFIKVVGGWAHHRAAFIEWLKRF
jgi:hypothetical protein